MYITSCEHLDGEQNLFLPAKVKKVLSSSVLNSLAPSYPFTFHLKIVFAYKEYHRKQNILQHYCSSVLLICVEKTKGSPK